MTVPFKGPTPGRLNSPAAPGCNVSVIIPSFNAREHLRDCIRAVVSSAAGFAEEVLVIDNASTDGSPEAIEAEFAGVRVVRNTNNSGFAGAVNQGLKLASGQYLMLLNSDVIIRDNTIEQLMHFLGKHPEAAAAGPKVLNPDGTLQNKGYFFPSVGYSLIVLFGLNRLLPEGLKRRLFPGFYWNENEVRPVDYLEGSCIMIRRDTLEEAGLFPENYFMYFEEAEWFFRTAKMGRRAWYMPDAEIIHIGRASPLNERNAVFDRSLLLFFRRNIGQCRGSLIVILQLIATALDSLLGISSENSNKTLLKQQMKQQFFLLKGLVFAGSREQKEKNA